MPISDEIKHKPGLLGAFTRRLAASALGLALLAALVSSAGTADAAAQGAPYYGNQSGPLELLRSYYNAVNRKEYRRAYGYWESAGTGLSSLPQSYRQFVRGYGDTASVVLRLGAWTGEGAAGSTYASVPVVITATHTDGSVHRFYGCYVARARNPMIENPPHRIAVWRIYSASVRVAPGNVSSATLLAQGCRR